MVSQKMMISKHETSNVQHPVLLLMSIMGMNLLDISLYLRFGKHNILNALGVIAVAYFENLDLKEVAEEMLTFPGVKRRFSEKS